MKLKILKKSFYLVISTLFLFSIAFKDIALAVPYYKLSKGQTVYVSIYSNIFTAPNKVPFNLATMLNIRNTDMFNTITITSADYYNTKGELVRKYYQNPIILAPLESEVIYLPERDESGGSGANFIVRWTAKKEVNIPIIESIMIGMKSGQGISFVSTGQEIKENTK